MRFRTLILKKKHFVIFLGCIAAVCVITSAVVSNIKGRAVSVFSQQEVYEDILKEGLPNSEDKNILKSILDSIAGFDTSRPESIIEENSPIFKEGQETAKATEQPPEATAAPEPTQAVTENSAPTKEQINHFSGIEISNSTSYSVNADELTSSELCFHTDNNGNPEVLIVHTHTTESYGEFGERNTDSQKNITAVGAAMKATLESHGIGVIHDTTVHDYPSYQGAYTRAYSTIKKNLESYPSIKVVLDVHRDGYVYADGTKLKKTTTINGESTAQVMIVSGTDSMGLDNPNWKENLKLGTKIQSAASIMYPTLMRPIDLRRERFNMHMTTGSLLLEVGANGNTLEEAIRGGTYAASALAAVLKTQ